MDIEFVRVAARRRATAMMACFLAAAAAFFIAAIPAASAKTPASAISDLLDRLRGRTALHSTAQRTRFVIGLTGRTEFQVFSLTRPNRVIVELAAVRMALPKHPGRRAVGLVKSFRVGRSAPGKSRIVINVTAPVIVEKAAIGKSTSGNGLHNLTLDIMPVAGTPNSRKRKKSRPGWVTASMGGFSRLGARNVQPPLPKRALSKAQRQATISRPVIVIDPGHGGRDTGAKRNGTVEAHVVLAFAKVLRDKLKATGRYKVLMTRDTDVFIPLDDRVAFADRHNAQLFMAIHADYARSSARGATIYSLRDSTARRLRRRSGRVDPSDVLTNKERRDIKRKALGDVSLVQNILADLASKERLVNHNRTSAFSKTVVRFMGKTTKLQGNAHRGAGFRVLRTAKVPSVLIELAFVTNRRDAALLKSKSWRAKVSGSIAKAVDNYFSTRVAQLPM